MSFYVLVGAPTGPDPRRAPLEPRAPQGPIPAGPHQGPGPRRARSLQGPTRAQGRAPQGPALQGPTRAQGPGPSGGPRAQGKAQGPGPDARAKRALDFSNYISMRQQCELRPFTSASSLCRAPPNFNLSSFLYT